MARHAHARLGRLHVAAIFVLGLTFALPVAASDLGAARTPATDERGHVAAPAFDRPVPTNPHASASREIAEAAALQRAAEAARAAAERAAQAKAAAAARAKAAQARAKAAQARAAAARTVTRVAAKPRVTAAKPRSSSTGSYSGRNRMWYPALGMSYSVSWFPCSRSRAPDNYVYRWGCAGYNNVYLMGHAWGKFRALNRAYYSGRLARGQLLVYADNSGRIHRYRLVWWRVYPPLTSASWAWASLSRPSATLQTCVGSGDSLRLFVRFVEV